MILIQLDLLLIKKGKKDKLIRNIYLDGHLLQKMRTIKIQRGNKLKVQIPTM